MAFLSFVWLLSVDFFNPLDWFFFIGANALRVLLVIAPPNGGRSPKEDCVLKTPLDWLRSGSEWSIELKDDVVEEPFDVANCWVALLTFESMGGPLRVPWSSLNLDSRTTDVIKNIDKSMIIRATNISLCLYLLYRHFFMLFMCSWIQSLGSEACWILAVSHTTLMAWASCIWWYCNLLLSRICGIQWAEKDSISKSWSMHIINY